MKSEHDLSNKKSREKPHMAKPNAPALLSHEQIVEKLMNRPGVRAEVKRIERTLSTRKR